MDLYTFLEIRTRWLLQQPPRAGVGVLLLCAERLLPFYAVFSERSEWGDVDALRSVIEDAWRFVVTGESNAEELRYRVVPDVVDAEGRVAVFGQLALAQVECAVEVMAGAAAEERRNATLFPVFEILSDLAPYEGDFVETERCQKELALQHDDLSRLANVPTLADVHALRARSVANAYAADADSDAPPAKKRVKVLFEVPEEDGIDVESMWAEPVADGYRLDNIPFFAYEVACRDVVAAEPDQDGALCFSALVTASGHSTVRLICEREDDVAPVRASLTEMGCSSELGGGRFVAVDVPPTVPYAEVRAYLEELAADGKLDYEESCLGQ